jgi:hypothetical protein
MPRLEKETAGIECYEAARADWPFRPAKGSRARRTRFPEERRIQPAATAPLAARLAVERTGVVKEKKLGRIPELSKLPLLLQTFKIAAERQVNVELDIIWISFKCDPPSRVVSSS